MAYFGNSLMLLPVVRVTCPVSLPPSGTRMFCVLTWVWDTSSFLSEELRISSLPMPDIEGYPGGLRHGWS